MSKLLSASLTAIVAVLSLMGALLTLREYSEFVEQWGLYITAASLVLGLFAAMIALLSYVYRIYAVNILVFSLISLALAAVVPYLPQAKEPPLSLDMMSVYGAVGRGNPAKIKKYFDAGVKTDMQVWLSMAVSEMKDDDFYSIAAEYPEELIRFCNYAKTSPYMSGLIPSPLTRRFEKICA
jgi:hypothetical protein